MAALFERIFSIEIARNRYSLTQWLLRQLPPLAAFRPALALFGKRKYGSGTRFVVGTLAGAHFIYEAQGDLVPEMVGLCGFWDWKCLAVAAVLCEPGDGIIEVGAHVGTETVGYAAIVGRRGTVTAFEPGKDAFRALARNIDANLFHHVKLVQAAVGDQVGRANFVKASADNSGSSFIGDGDGDEVAITTLDAAVNGGAKLLVIDVEGFEVRALRGGRAYIERHRPVMILESYGAALRRAGSSAEELAAELAAQQYVVYRMQRLGFERVTHFKPDNVSENWLCMPAEREASIRQIDRALKIYAFTPCIFGLHPIARRARRAARFAQT